MALSENQLVVPALIAMLNSPNGEIQTTALIDEISGQFALDNQDLSPLLNRNDEKYTQIVRNLKSHKTFIKKGLVLLSPKLGAQNGHCAGRRIRPLTRDTQVVRAIFRICP